MAGDDPCRLPEHSAGRGKGISLNSDSLAPKSLASSGYVRVPEARCPHTRSIAVTSLFPSPLLKPKDLLDCDESTRTKKISEDQEKKRDLEDTRFQAELGLRYALVNPR